jgi:hypothetical protein
VLTGADSDEDRVMLSQVSVIFTRMNSRLAHAPASRDSLAARCRSDER